jgi:glycosylphosphatidylinositol transamidase
MNNLLERLHASFFFYVFIAPSRFLQLPHYLPPPIIISVAMSFGGLALYVWTGWERTKNGKTGALGEWRMRDRPIMEVLCIMITTHVFGGMMLLLTTNGIFIRLLPVRCTPSVNYQSSLLLRSGQWCCTGW